MWGATIIAERLEIGYLNFNPRSPCGERLVAAQDAFTTVRFQSTLPVWGATVLIVPRLYAGVFQSTLPVWGATAAPFILVRGHDLFQSTLPVWGATLRLAVVTQMYYISIHAPRVGSDLGDPSTLGVLSHISIHAPRVGSDATFYQTVAQICYFNPRSPCGERL